MPRLESIAKAGYFATPPPVVDRIAAMIRPATHGGRVAVRLLDPCAGTGHALHQLARATGGETYGIELEADRYAEASKLLKHALHASAFTVRVANEAFSGLFLNPPYDVDVDAKRLEHTFLTSMTRYLRPLGLLVYIVPQRRLAESARYLAGHYQQLACWRFPDGEFEAFRQVVLFGIKREQPGADSDLKARVEAWASEPLPPLSDVGSVRPGYTLPVLPAGDVLFTSQFFKPSVAAAEARRVGLWTHTVLVERIWPPEERRVRPLMPLKRGHLAVLVAAGLLDNVLLDSGGELLLVKGRTFKVSVPVESSDEDVEIEREVLRTSVVTLNLHTGRIETIGVGGSDSTSP